MSKIYVLSHFHCCSVSLAWWNTFHSELIIHLHRHPSIYIGFLFYCMSLEAKGCQMKLLSFCILLNYQLSQKLKLLGNGEFARDTQHELIIAIEEEVQKGSNVTNGNQQILWIIDSIEHLLFQSGLSHVLPLFSNVRETSYTPLSYFLFFCHFSLMKYIS